MTSLLVASALSFAICGHAGGHPEAVAFSQQRNTQRGTKHNLAQALNNLQKKTAKFLLAHAKFRATVATYKEASAQLERMETITRRGVISAEELGRSRLTKTKAREATANCAEKVKRANREAESAMLILVNESLKTALR